MAPLAQNTPSRWDYHGWEWSLQTVSLTPYGWPYPQGVENLRRILEAATEFGIKILTIYAFSSENMMRFSPTISVNVITAASKPSISL